MRGPRPFSHRISGSADQHRAPPRDPTARRGGRHHSEGFLRSVVGWLLHRLPGPDVGACVPARPRRNAGRTQAAAAPASGASVSPVATGTAAAGGGKARAPQVSPRRHPHQPPTNPRPQPPTWPRPRPASRAAGAGPGRGPELVKTPAVSEGSSFPTPEGRQALYRSIITRSQMVFWELRSPRAPLRRPRHSEAEPGTNAAAAGPGRASAAARRGNGRRARTHRPATERVCRPGPRGGGGAWRTPRGPLQVAPHPGDLGQGTAS